MYEIYNMYMNEAANMKSRMIMEKNEDIDLNGLDMTTNLYPVLMNEIVVYMNVIDQTLVREFLAVSEATLKDASMSTLIIESNFGRQWILMKLLNAEKETEKIFPSSGVKFETPKTNEGFKNDQKKRNEIANQVSCFLDYIILCLAPNSKHGGDFLDVLESTLGTAVLKAVVSSIDNRQVELLLKTWDSKLDTTIESENGKEFLACLLNRTTSTENFDRFLNSVLLQNELTRASDNRLDTYEALIKHPCGNDALLGFFWELNANVLGYYDSMLKMIFNKKLSSLLRASVCHFIGSVGWKCHVQNLCFILHKHENIGKEICFNETSQEFLMSLIAVLNNYADFFHEDLRMIRMLSRVGFEKMLFNSVGIKIFKFLMHTTHRIKVIEIVFPEVFAIKSNDLSKKEVTKTLTEAFRHDIATLGLLEAMITEPNLQVKEAVLLWLSQHQRFVAPKKIWDTYLNFN